MCLFKEFLLQQTTYYTSPKGIYIEAWSSPVQCHYPHFIEKETDDHRGYKPVKDQLVSGRMESRLPGWHQRLSSLPHGSRYLLDWSMLEATHLDPQQSHPVVDRWPFGSQLMDDEAKSLEMNPAQPISSGLYRMWGFILSYLGVRGLILTLPWGAYSLRQGHKEWRLGEGKSSSTWGLWEALWKR